MSAAAFMNVPEAKQLRGKNAFRATGQRGEYTVEPAYEGRQVVYTASCQPPGRTISEDCEPPASPQSPAKRYPSVWLAKAAAQKYESNAPIHLFGADIYFHPSQFATAPLSKAQIVANIRRLQDHPGAVWRADAINSNKFVGVVGVFVKNGHLWAKNAGNAALVIYRDPENLQRPLRHSKKLQELHIAVRGDD